MLSQSQIRQAWAPPCRGPWGTVYLYGGGRATVRGSAVEATKALNECLKKWKYATRYKDTGAYVCRQKVGGNGWSNHSYATAIDINWQLNPYGGSRYHMPYAMALAICRIRTNNGRQVWNWGGFWNGTRDWMHFEIVCSARDLATGINWRTLPGITAVPPTVPKAPTPKPVPKPEEREDDEEMATAYIRLNDSKHSQNGRVEAVSDFSRRHIARQDEYNMLLFFGAKIQNVNAATWTAMTANKTIHPIK